MDNVLADVKIFKISIGPDLKKGMSYQVGQKVYTGKGDDRVESIIKRIVRSEQNFHLFGNIAYVIYAQRSDNKKEFIFRFFENMPVYVTGVTPDSEMERIVDQQFLFHESTTK